jgi:hypothetical protein
MTDDSIAKGILKFVRQLDGGDDDRVRSAAIARRWLDQSGAPTPDGERLIRSFEDLRRTVTR